MGKKAKRGSKKNASKLNRQAIPKSVETEQIQKPKESEPISSGKSTFKKSDAPKRKPLWWKIVSAIVSLIILLLGYEGLWPKVIIEPSEAVDAGPMGYQFTLENEPCYPVKIISVEIRVIDLEWEETNQQAERISRITFEHKYTETVQISGRDSVTMSFFNAGSYPHRDKLKLDSKMIVDIAYQLPLVGMIKIDSALFETARDKEGNSIWIKKPLGNYANYTNSTYIDFIPTIERY